METSIEDSLEQLISKIDFPETPTAIEVEKHGKFLEWLGGINSEDFKGAFKDYVLPALNLGMTLVDNDIIDSDTMRDFYRYKFILELFNQWESK